jgi:glutamate synthase (ferredoxin)
MMRVCHLNTCPVGIATQDPRLRAKFTGDPEHTVRFLRFVAEEVRELMAQLGVRHFDELIGRSDWLEAEAAIDHWKAKGLDLSPILHRPEVPEAVGHRCLQAQDHGLEQSLDQRQLLALAAPTLEQGIAVRAELKIRNTDRVVGTQLGSALTRRYPDGLPDDTVQLHFRGTAGQSFGAFIPRGLTLSLEGEANDYLGKGLSGGRIIVFPPREATFAPEANIIAGNVAFYGATGGEAFLNGQVGERFCVRNSGVRAVVEGVGDHGCEYMTGGIAVILGPTGRNFAAGMSGGVAYVLDRTGDFAQRCNREMVNLERLTQPREITELQELVRRHHQLTGSARAAEVLADWEASLACFVKVIPNDYQRVLEAIARAEAEGLSGDEALAAAFEANARDLARIGGG